MGRRGKMQQKDYIVTFTVLDRVVHKIIVRAADVYTAKTVAISVVNDICQLNEKEFEQLEYFAELFNHLDSHEFFVCF
jgi:hypothetical protein